MEKTTISVKGEQEDAIRVGPLFVATDEVVRRRDGEALLSTNAGEDWHQLLLAVREAAGYYHTVTSQAEELTAARAELDELRHAVAVFAANVHQEAIDQGYCTEGYNGFIANQPEILGLRKRTQDYRVQLERYVNERQTTLLIVEAASEDEASDFARKLATDASWDVRERDVNNESLDVLDVDTA